MADKARSRAPFGARNRKPAWLVPLVAGVIAAAAMPSGAQAADRTATPATLASQFAAAQSGDRILLAGGDYGTFRGGSKTGRVTIAPQSGATATMAVDFNPAANITLDGLTITGLNIAGTTRDVTVSNSRFTGSAVIRTSQMNNNNIVLDRNTHSNISVCSTCYEGRITLPGRSETNPSGVTIQNSRFGPGGNSDGIQNGSNGTRIIGNEFTGIQQGDPSLAHSDPLQLYGSKNTVVRGNFIHDNASGIMSGDGTDHEVIEDNVIVRIGNSPIILGPDNGSIVRHNTIGGTLRVCDASGTGTCNDPRRPSTGTVVKDNVMSTLWVNGSGVSFAEENYNVIGSTSPSGYKLGANDIRGNATFVGGPAPTTYDGYRLAAGSLGKGNASDGLDRGIRAGSTSAPAPAPAPAPSPSPTPSPTPPPNTDVPAQAVWTAPTGAKVGVPVTLDGTRSKGNGPISCTWSFEDQSGATIWGTKTGCKISMTFANADTKYVKLIVKDADGDTHSSRKSFAVTR